MYRFKQMHKVSGHTVRLYTGGFMRSALSSISCLSSLQKQKYVKNDDGRATLFLFNVPIDKNPDAAGQVQHGEPAELGEVSAAGASPVTGQPVLGDLWGAVALAPGDPRQLHPATSARYWIRGPPAAAGGAEGKRTTTGLMSHMRFRHREGSYPGLRMAWHHAY